MSKPKEVKVGPQVYQIIFRSKREDGLLNENNYGYIIDTSNTIVIDADAPLNKQQVTLWHELFHAARMTFDTGTRPSTEIEYEELEHHFIGVWEASLLAILKDNPELMFWLTKEKNEIKKETKRSGLRHVR